MSGDIRDIQTSALSFGNDSAEEVIYAVLIPAGTITTATRYQMVLTGVVSTKGAGPGTLTLRIRLGGNVCVVVSEALVAGASNARFTCNLEAWLRSDGQTALGGFFAQNASDLFATPGVRLGNAPTTTDLSVDQLLTATAQFDTADPANVFTRGSAVLIAITG